MGGDDSLRELLDTRRSVLLAFKNPAGRRQAPTCFWAIGRLLTMGGKGSKLWTQAMDWDAIPSHMNAVYTWYEQVGTTCEFTHTGAVDTTKYPARSILGPVSLNYWEKRDGKDVYRLTDGPGGLAALEQQLRDATPAAGRGRPNGEGPRQRKAGV